MDFDADAYVKKYNWLPETKELITKCLNKDFRMRPTVKELL